MCKTKDILVDLKIYVKLLMCLPVVGSLPLESSTLGVMGRDGLVFSSNMMSWGTSSSVCGGPKCYWQEDCGCS